MNNINKLIEKNKSSILYLRIYETWEQLNLKNKSVIVKLLINTISGIVKAISFGKIDLMPSDVVLIIKKGYINKGGM